MESTKSDSETVEYWRKQAEHYEQKASELQQELDEYTENSAQLEKELEATIVQVEKQNRDLEHQNERLKNEIEMLRKKLERSQHETNALENELQTLKIEKDKQAVYIRELEQKNDDLERAQRVISESVSCIDALLSQAYERNAVLESELDQMESLKVHLQRATDETRDLKQELKAQERVVILKKEDNSPNDNNLVNGHLSNSSKAQTETETQTTLPTPQKREINGNAMTPSTRVIALNMVGDLLRKVGLEKLLCPHCGKLKCGCNAQPPPTNHVPQADEENVEKLENNNTNVNPQRDQIEYRDTEVTLSRQVSNTDCVPAQNLKHRSSDQPFARSGQGENGKLRRSFAVRSREGIEHLLGLSSVKKNHHAPAKSKHPSHE